MVSELDLMIVEEFFNTLDIPEMDMEILQFKTACYYRWATQEIFDRLWTCVVNDIDVNALDVISEFEADMERYICRTEDDLDQCLIFEVAADTAEAIKIFSNNMENHD